ncbi:MAG: coproporphyrinogen-III oxidase family protein, partial [Candidatus Omnitrophota bacterium]
MIGLYVHVPFCAGKCFYCNFMTTAFRSPERQAQYLEALSRECAFYRERLKSKRFDTLYVGGGTPSCLGPESTERLFAIVRKHFRFGRNAEVTFEVNPEDVDGTAALAWKRLGISRISLGAQCFDDGILRRLGRSHGAVKIAEAFGSLRAAGFGNINLDLMLALPGQSVRSFERSLAEAAALDPEHVSLYELVVEPKTALGRLREHSRLR